MKKNILLSMTLCLCIAMQVQNRLCAQDGNTALLTIDAQKQGHVISPLLFGYNLEHTRRAIWQGIGAEMIANRKLARIPVKDVFEPLPAGAIRLHGQYEGFIKNSVEHWNKGIVPYQQLVQLFRDGEPMFAMGCMWGLSVRSGALLYRYTQDAELKKILDATVADCLTTQQPNGSISATPESKQPGGKNGDIFERHDTMLGMLYYYELVHSDRKVLESVIKQADCIIAQIGEGEGKKDLFYSGWSANCIESADLLEPFVKLYNISGEERFLDFAKYILKTGGAKGANVFQQAFDNVPPHQIGVPYPKAYEMMELFDGVVQYYKTTGEDFYRQSAIRLYQSIRDKEMMLIGTGGADQPYFPGWGGEAWDNTAIEQTNPNIRFMAETCTGSLWTRYCRAILFLTGESTVADELERYLVNSLPSVVKPDGKDCFTHSNLNGRKVNSDRGWGYQFPQKATNEETPAGKINVTCCNLNMPITLAHIPLVAVVSERNCPAVNLYIPATVKMKTPKGKPLTLEIITDFPKSGDVKIKVNVEKPEEFTVKLRIPSWSENTRLAGANMQLPVPQPGKYAEIKRTWQTGDEIQLTFDMRCKLIDAPKGGSSRNSDRYKALQYGPLVLCRNSETDPKYNKPVTIIADRDGFVDAKPATLADGSLVFDIPAMEGSIKMYPYAHVNGWKGAKVQTWLPMPR